MVGPTSHSAAPDSPQVGPSSADRRETGAEHADELKTEHRHGHGNYGRFAAMIGTSTVLMYGLMYLNTYAVDHVEFSQTRLFMTLIMGAAMAVVMLGFMRRMYTRSAVNRWIFVGAFVVFVSALWLVRSQRTVDDAAWMEAMIPHHSIAILTSERARISDPRVRALADRIIETQRREITEMQSLIVDLRAARTD
jgi:hypothetical protein